ncbi:MAG: PEP-CTERM sorting domain-containing protein [Prochlorothrix sp.]
MAISSGSNVGFSFSLVPIDPVLGVPVAEFLFTDSIAACATIACNWSSNNLFALARFGSTFFPLPPSSFAFTTTPQAVPEPLTLLGTAAALGSGLLMRKRSAQ